MTRAQAIGALVVLLTVALAYAVDAFLHGRRSRNAARTATPSLSTEEVNS